MTDIPPPDAATLRRAVIASVIGNGLEWFDFLIYGFFAAVIAEVFFPARDPELSLILTFATFGVGFVVRPLGGVLIGIYADHAGRQKALSMLIAVMAVGTVMLGITPSYAAIGLAAPILVVAARVLQGLSVGGEFASSTALLVEYAPPGRRHYFGAFQMVAQSFAVALAAGMGFVLTTCLSPQALAAWGWRVPFLLGGLVGPVGFYIRRRVADAPEFLEARRQAKARAERAPLALVLADYRGPLLCAIGTIVCGTAATYLWNSYLPVYVVRTLHLPLAAPLAGIAVCGLINMVVNPAAGALADRIGPYRVFFPAVIASGLLTYPLFAFVVAHPSRLNLFCVQLAATLLLGLTAGPIPGLLGSFFPPRALDRAFHQLQPLGHPLRRLGAAHRHLALRAHHQPLRAGFLSRRIGGPVADPGRRLPSPPAPRSDRRHCPSGAGLTQPSAANSARSRTMRRSARRCAWSATSRVRASAPSGAR